MPTYSGSASGLVGTLGVTVVDDATGAIVAARSTAGITEPVAGSAVYWRAAPAVGQTLVWTETAGGYGAADPAAPDNAGIAAAKAAAEAANGKLPADTAAKLARLDAAVSSVGGVPEDYVAVTQATLGTDGAALGGVPPEATVVATLKNGGPGKWRTLAEVDGDFTIYLPRGAAYVLVARKGGYADTTAEVAVP